MPKKDHKAQKAKARQQAIRKQKAQAGAQPRIFRENPGLGAALSPRHLLVGYFVNEDWRAAKTASIHCIREAGDGQVIASFLVDLSWKGTTDCYGRSGLGNALAELEQRLAEVEEEHDEVPTKLVSLDTAVAVNLIRGGVAWARQLHRPLPHDLELWLRLVDPLPPAGPDLSIFGDGAGNPIILDTFDESLHADVSLDELLWAAEGEGWAEDEADDWAADDDNIIEGEILAQSPGAPMAPPLPAPPAWQPRRSGGLGGPRTL